MVRMFKEFSTGHLPYSEIEWLHAEVKRGLTSVYQNDAGFFVWTGLFNLTDCPSHLWQILLTVPDQIDYVLFDRDVELDPDLPNFEW